MSCDCRHVCNAKSYDSPGCLWWVSALIIVSILLGGIAVDVRELREVVEARLPAPDTVATDTTGNPVPRTVP